MAYKLHSTHPILWPLFLCEFLTKFPHDINISQLSRAFLFSHHFCELSRISTTFKYKTHNFSHLKTNMLKYIETKWSIISRRHLSNSKIQRCIFARCKRAFDSVRTWQMRAELIFPICKIRVFLAKKRTKSVPWKKKWRRAERDEPGRVIKFNLRGWLAAKLSEVKSADTFRIFGGKNGRRVWGGRRSAISRAEKWRVKVSRYAIILSVENKGATFRSDRGRVLRISLFDLCWKKAVTVSTGFY